MTGRETPNLLFGGSMPHLAIGFLIFGGFFCCIELTVLSICICFIGY